jgi:hypothetical protein
VAAKGRLLTADDARSLQGLGELNVLSMDPGDVHEEAAGRRLAAAVAGEGVEALPAAGGTFPLAARAGGIVEVDAARLARLNEIDDVAVSTLPHEQVVAAGEVVGRAKIVPFVTSEDRLRRAEEAAAPGLLRVRRFVPLRVVAVVEDRIDAAALARFRRDFEEKLRFFGSELVAVEQAAGTPDGLAAALRTAVSRGAQLLVLAGGRPMDPLDPALQALERAGGKLVRHGVPVHPGALLWVGVVGEAQVIGVPSCGIASRATSLDLVLPRACAGERLSRQLLASLGAGGMLTRESAFRLPPYRRTAARGELDAP